MAGASKTASKLPVAQVNPVKEKAAVQAEEEEIVEDYDPSMSPKPSEFARLPYEDRQLSIVEAKEDLKALVIILYIKWHARY